MKMKHHLVTTNLELLDELDQFLSSLPEELYQDKTKGSSIGMHIRHILEFYAQLEDAVTSSSFSYDHRKRDTSIENSTLKAREKISGISEFLSNLNGPLSEIITLQAACSISSPDLEIKTTLGRELYHVSEHTTHHLAIIKLLVNEYEFSDSFGVAASTRRAVGQ